MTKEELLAKFAKVEFHVSGGGPYNIVAAFEPGPFYGELSDLMVLDGSHDFERLDDMGNVLLNDNGDPFRSSKSAVAQLIRVFKTAIDEGLVTGKAIRAQVTFWDGQVGRSVFNRA